MKKALLLFICSLLLLGGLVGCDKKTPANDGEKVLKVGLGSKTNVLDLPIPTDTVSHFVMTQLYEGLFSLGSDGNAVNELADSYTISDDGTVYTITLKDANWSDGQPITAHDFEYGIKRSLYFGVGAAEYVSLITDYVVNADKIAPETPLDQMGDVGVKALDDKTLEITINVPTNYFLTLLSQKVYFPLREDFAPLGDSSWADGPDHPFNGPFKIESNKIGEEIVLVKNDAYRNADKVNLDKVILTIMEDQAAQLNAYQTGDIDFAMNVDQAVIKTLPENEIFVVPSIVNYQIVFNVENTNGTAPGLSDIRVRKALSMAVNRELIAATVAGVNIPLYGTVPVGLPGIDGDFRTEQDNAAKYQAVYDVEAAKALMEEAGYNENNRLKFVYTTNQNARHSDTAQLLQDMWREIYVDLEIEFKEFQVYLDDATNGTFESRRHAFSADYIDPVCYIELFTTDKLETDYFSIPEYDALVAASKLEADNVKRLEMLHAAEKILVEDNVALIPLYSYSTGDLLKPNVTGFESAPDGTIYLRYADIK